MSAPAAGGNSPPKSGQTPVAGLDAAGAETAPGIPTSRGAPAGTDRQIFSGSADHFFAATTRFNGKATAAAARTARPPPPRPVQKEYIQRRQPGHQRGRQSRRLRPG